MPTKKKKAAKAGRPPLEETRNERIHIPVTPREKEIAEWLAQNERRELAPYMRELLFREYERVQRQLRRRRR